MLKDKVFLTSTDTTIGFVSQNSDRLNEIKHRPQNKKFIKAINSLQTLKSFTRVPRKYCNMLRRSQKTTFIINNISFRVVNEANHLLLINRLQWAYTTSANESGKDFNIDFVTNQCDVIVSPFEAKIEKSSQIFKINNYAIKRIRV